MTVEEIEVGHEIDRALRAGVTGLAQLIERSARRRADNDRASASAAREDWLAHRDVARQRYVPWLRAGVVENGNSATGAAKAWAAAAAWSTMDPMAKAAEEQLAARIRETYGNEPTQLLQETTSARTPSSEEMGQAKALTMDEAMELSDGYAPYYYWADDAIDPTGPTPSTEAEKQFLGDWQHFAETGELPERSKWEAWAKHAGYGDQIDIDQWQVKKGILRRETTDHEARDEVLERIWNEGSEERAAHEAEHAQMALAKAEMKNLQSQVGQPESHTWEALTDPTAFNKAEPAEITQAWRDARAAGAHDAATQLGQMVREKYGLDPNEYLLGAMTERAATNAEARRTAEDKAQMSSEQRGFETVPLKEIDAAGLTLTITNDVKQLPGVDQETVQQAMSDAAYLHRGQARMNRGDFDRTPYIEHPLRNTLRLRRWGVDDQDVLVASILHDTVEDNPQGLVDLVQSADSSQTDRPAVSTGAKTSPAQNQTAALDALSGRYGQRVAGIVEGVTNPPREAGQSDTDRASAYADHIKQAVSENPETLLVKLADFGDNAAGLHHNATAENSDKVAKSANKYLPVCDILSTEVTRQAPELNKLVSPEALPAIQKMLNDTKNRLKSLTTTGSTTADSSAPLAAAEHQRGSGAASETTPAVSRDRVVELNQQAQDYFAANFRPGSTGHQYITDRLGEGAVQGPWALGYAPGGWTNLTRQLQRNGASDAEILGAGLGRMSSRGNVIDAFRNRAMVGIRDNQGDLVGFVGRDLSGDERAPKYVNTGQTPAFKKSHEVFGLYEAPANAKIVRSEGAFDAIAVTLASDGEAAGVAPMGTAMSKAQAGAIAERADGRVWLANDRDEAGLKATEHDYHTLAEQGVQARSLTIPGDDPASAWQENPALMRVAVTSLDSAPSAGETIIDHYIDSNADALRHDDAQARRELDDTVREVTTVNSDPIERRLLAVNAEQRRQDLLHAADTAAAEGTRLDHVGDRLEAASDITDNPANANRLDDAAGRVNHRRDDADAAAENLFGESSVPAAETATPYDRSTESKLEELPSAAREARVVSSHGYSRSTADAVADAPVRTKGTSARPDRPTFNQQQGRKRTR